MASLSLRDRQIISALFNELDEDGNGYLDRKEFAACFCRLGYRLTDVQTESLFRAVDANADGKVTFDEFLKIFAQAQQSHPQQSRRASLRRVFEEMDVNGDGYLSRAELVQGLRQAGVLSKDFTDAQATQLMNSIDRNGDGRISFEEFITLFEY